MELLYQRTLYGEVLAIRIEAMGATAVAIANRWALGWLDRVREMLVSQSYLERLANQTELEKDMLIDAIGLTNLSLHEIRELYGVREAP